MATVAIDVSSYKELWRLALLIYEGVYGDDCIGNWLEDHPQLPEPQEVCDHCGFVNDGEFDGVCPRCGKNPELPEPMAFGIPTQELLAEFGDGEFKDEQSLREYWDTHPGSNDRWAVRVALLKLHNETL